MIIQRAVDVKSYLKYYLPTRVFGRKLITQRFNDIYSIDYEALARKGIKVIGFDVDDTLVGHLGEVEEQTLNFIVGLTKLGLKVGIFSNCGPKRNKKLKEIFDFTSVYYVWRSDKPNPEGYIEIAQHFNENVSECAFVGDKASTDIFGAYLAGYRERILVKPYSFIKNGKKANIFARLLRKIENILAF